MLDCQEVRQRESYRRFANPTFEVDDARHNRHGYIPFAVAREPSRNHRRRYSTWLGVSCQEAFLGYRTFEAERVRTKDEIQADDLAIYRLRPARQIGSLHRNNHQPPNNHDKRQDQQHNIARYIRCLMPRQVEYRRAHHHDATGQ